MTFPFAIGGFLALVIGALEENGMAVAMGFLAFVVGSIGYITNVFLTWWRHG